MCGGDPATSALGIATLREYSNWETNENFLATCDISTLNQNVGIWSSFWGRGTFLFLLLCLPSAQSSQLESYDPS